MKEKKRKKIKLQLKKYYNKYKEVKVFHEAKAGF